MADDGMLLNFAFTDEAPLHSRTTVKGGAWRQRRKVELMQRAGERRKEGIPPPVREDRPAVKRQRLDAERTTHDTRPVARSNQTRDDVQQRRQPQVQKSGPKQIVSSLFSYNPKTTIEKAEVVEEPTLEPSNAPLTAEQMNFTNLGLSASLAGHLTTKMNITAPTSVQKAALTALLKDDTDAFLQAETGSGKTLAYVLPIVQRLIDLSAKHKESGDGLHRNSGLFAIVLTPTRELSKQVSVVLENILRCAHWLVAGSVIGGEKKQSEKARLRKGVNILVATPGRLADHLDHTTTLDVSKVRWLVLDEGDRLMELGFEDDLEKIITKLDNRMSRANDGILGLPAKRINILCSATMRMDVQKLGEISLKDAVHIQADSRDAAGSKGIAILDQESAFSAPAQLKQSYITTPAKLRLVTLHALLKRSFARKGATSKAIVFISCADSVDFHFEALARELKADQEQDEDAAVEKKSKDGSQRPPRANEKRPLKRRADEPSSTESLKTQSPAPTLSSDPSSTPTIYRLHGSLPQNIRTSTLKSFSASTTPGILLCTDVASRGLDLPDIDLVIEYDPPFSKEDHLHRIGRTARAGKDGRATIFLQPGCEEGYVDILKEERKDSGAVVSGQSAEEHLRKGFSALGLQSKSQVQTISWSESATTWQLNVERWILSHPRLLELARRGYQSHIRAYATHVSSERSMFDIKELHLGHLAKAFGLRDRPAKINVPGLRREAGAVKSDRRKAGAGTVARGSRDSGRAGGGVAKAPRVATSRPSDAFGDADDGKDTNVDMEEAAKLMRKKARMAMAGASEFNLA